MRLVSLCPSLTELVFSLGSGEELVGCTRYCVHPVDALKTTEDVGGTKDPDLERIIELAPDLVLFNEEENRREDHQALVEAGLACYGTFPKNALETAAMVRGIGAAIERQACADQIAGDIEARVAKVREAARAASAVRFAYLIWRGPWMSVNADTFASALLCDAGGVNVFSGEPQRYPVIELSALAAARPDTVLLSTEPFLFNATHVVEVAAALGLDARRVAVVDGEYLSWHGSRTPDGVDYAAGLVRAARDLGPRK